MKNNQQIEEDEQDDQDIEITSVSHYLQILGKLHPEFLFNADDIPEIIIEHIFDQPALYNTLLAIDLQLEDFLLNQKVKDSAKQVKRNGIFRHSTKGIPKI